VLTAGVGLTAIAVEVLKLLVRRQLPDHPDGIYSFRAWSDRPFDTGGLAFPSSHAAIAFAGAWVMCRLFPRAAPIWLLIGVGCAWERLATGSHFLSDVTASAALAYFVTWPLLYRRRLYLDRHREELHASGEYSI
jgi:membrane-associated phospholipid phosphatase